MTLTVQEAEDREPAPAEEMSSQEMLVKLLADPNMAATLKQLAQAL